MLFLLNKIRVKFILMRLRKANYQKRVVLILNNGIFLDSYSLPFLNLAKVLLHLIFSLAIISINI